VINTAKLAVISKAKWQFKKLDAAQLLLSRTLCIKNGKVLE